MGLGKELEKGNKKREIRVFIFGGRVANELVSLLYFALSLCITLLEWGRGVMECGGASKVGFLVYFIFRSFLFITF